jgi:hypothetical protein
VTEPSKPDVEIGPTGPREKRPKRPVKRKPDRHRGEEGRAIEGLLERNPPPDGPSAA